MSLITDVKKSDQFMEVLSAFFSRLSSHSRKFLWLAVALLVVAGLVTLAMNRHTAKLSKARDALFSAEQALEAEMKNLGLADANKKADVDKILVGSMAQMKDVAEKFRGTKAAMEAELRIGDIYYDYGESDKAVDWYQKAAEHSSGSFEKALALMSMGYSYENTGKCVEAVNSFEKALALGEESLKGDLLMAEARCYETMKDFSKARTAYDKILSQLPSTDHAKTAETLKANLEQ
ncbi:MAG: tetratricopeptide repeat protein [Bdellovibrionota bacterium]|mgnify:CR=1 FL=1